MTRPFGENPAAGDEPEDKAIVPNTKTALADRSWELAARRLGGTAGRTPHAGSSELCHGQDRGGEPAPVAPTQGASPCGVQVTS